MSQQVGAALGLAVLVTVFDSVTSVGPAGLTEGAAASVRSALTHGLDITFGVGAAFMLAALVVVAALVRRPAAQPATEIEPEPELEMVESAA